VGASTFCLSSSGVNANGRLQIALKVPSQHLQEVNVRFALSCGRSRLYYCFL